MKPVFAVCITLLLLQAVDGYFSQGRHTRAACDMTANIAQSWR